MPTFTFTKSYSDGAVLTEAQLDDLKTSGETFLNTTKIDSDNIQTGGVVAAAIGTAAVTTAKLDSQAVTVAKIDEGLIGDLTLVTAVPSDYVSISDTSDSAKNKKALVSDITNKIYRSVTTTDAPTVVDSVLKLSGASFTVTLPTAVGNQGKVFEFLHAGDHVTQVYTIDGNGSETIGGATTYLLYTTNERLKIISDNANWQILSHETHTGWVAFTGTSTWNTGLTSNSGFWRRIGENIEVDQAIICSGAPTATTLNHTLPLSLTMATAKMSDPTQFQQRLGSGIATDTGNQGYALYCFYLTNSTIDVQYNNSNGSLIGGSVSSTTPFSFGNTDAVQVNYSCPITGWNP